MGTKEMGGRCGLILTFIVVSDGAGVWLKFAFGSRIWWWEMLSYEYF